MDAKTKAAAVAWLDQQYNEKKAAAEAQPVLSGETDDSRMDRELRSIETRRELLLLSVIRGVIAGQPTHGRTP